MSGERDDGKLTRRKFLRAAGVGAGVVGFVASGYTVVHDVIPALFGHRARNVSSQPTATGAPSPTATEQPTPKPTPTEAPPKPGQLLYKADWSRGADGWQVGGSWKVVDGQLVNDGISDGYILAPFSPTTRNYRLDMDALMPNGFIEVGFVARVAPGGGNTEGILAKTPCNLVDQTIIENLATGSSNIGTGNIIEESKWHHLRFEAKDIKFTLYSDGQVVDVFNDAENLNSGQVGIYSNGFSGEGVATFKNFSVTAL